MFKKLMLVSVVTALYGCGGGGHEPPVLQQRMDAPPAASGPTAKAMSINTASNLNLDDIDRGSFCYTETHNMTADVSDIRSAFNAGNWLQTITGLYARRWPSGKALAEAQANDQYFKGFVDTSSFNKLAESMMVAIHEETHMWDLASSRSEWDNFSSSWITDQLQFLKFKLYTSDGGFPRKEILSLIKDDASSETDDVYLKNAQQGEYRLNGVTAELNASLMGLPAAAVLGEFVDGVGASNSRNLTLTNLSYLQLYLRVAKSKYPSYYSKLKSDATLRKYVVVQFLRNAYWITQSERWAAKLGNATKVQALIQRVYAPENLAILEDFSGYKLPTSISDNCMGAGGAPAISSQPAALTVTAGQPASFSVQASGADLKFQWRRNGAEIGGASAASYTLPSTTVADNGAQFSVVVSNAKGSVTSANAVLTVKSADATLPVITSQPTSLTANVGQTATFSITATSSSALSYQWRKNGANIAGATSARYTTPVLAATDNGTQYSVVVSNSAGSVTSGDALLTIKAADTGGTTRTGTLSDGGSLVLPGGSNGYYQSTGGGTFSARLTGAANTDFDLYLYKWNGSSWAVVAKSEGPTSTESLTYQGTPGFYYLQVKSYPGTGGGNYSITYTLPK